MNLDVPLCRQKKDSKDCGIVCVQMILAFYKKEKTFKEIKEYIEVHEEGTYAPQIGSYFIKNGFNVEILTLHPSLFTLKNIGKSQTFIQEHIKNLGKTATSEFDKKALRYFEEYLLLGGRLTPQIPAIEDVQQSINKKQPLIALLTSNFLTESQPSFNFHFNVITGYTDGEIFHNDPLDDHRGGKHKTSLQNFFFGMQASIYGGLDNGSLMKISPQSKF